MKDQSKTDKPVSEGSESPRTSAPSLKESTSSHLQEAKDASKQDRDDGKAEESIGKKEKSITHSPSSTKESHHREQKSQPPPKQARKEEKEQNEGENETGGDGKESNTLDAGKSSQSSSEVAMPGRNAPIIFPGSSYQGVPFMPSHSFAFHGMPLQPDAQQQHQVGSQAGTSGKKEAGENSVPDKSSLSMGGQFQPAQLMQQSNSNISMAPFSVQLPPGFVAAGGSGGSSLPSGYSSNAQFAYPLTAAFMPPHFPQGLVQHGGQVGYVYYPIPPQQQQQFQAMDELKGKSNESGTVNPASSSSSSSSMSSNSSQNASSGQEVGVSSHTSPNLMPTYSMVPSNVSSSQKPEQQQQHYPMAFYAAPMQGMPLTETFRRKLQKGATSLQVFESFVVQGVDSMGNPFVDTSRILSRECFEAWVVSRKQPLRSPEEAFRKALVSYITVADGASRPFTPEVESSLLKLLRRREIWPCFRGRHYSDGKPVLIGSNGIRCKGYHEQKLENGDSVEDPQRRKSRKKQKTDKGQTKG